MIKEYFRPKNLGEASDILKNNPLAIPIGGGTSVKQINREIVVVDLQDLNLKFIRKDGGKVAIGSGTTLDQMGNYFSENCSLVRAVKIEGSKNQRNTASLAGLIKLATGRSALLTCLLSLDAFVTFEAEKDELPLVEFLEIRDGNKKLITKLTFDEPTGLLFESVSRSPLDLPIVCCSYYKNEKLTRAAVGGFGVTPRTVPEEYFTGKNHLHISEHIDFVDDEWATAEYRSAVTQIILNRLVESNIKGNK